MRDDLPLDQQRYIVRERDGMYSKRVESDYASATCPVHFTWTRHRHLAAEFTFEELHDRHAAISLMQQLIHGHAGASIKRIQ